MDDSPVRRKRSYAILAGSSRKGNVFVVIATSVLLLESCASGSCFERRGVGVLVYLVGLVDCHLFCHVIGLFTPLWDGIGYVDCWSKALQDLLS